MIRIISSLLLLVLSSAVAAQIDQGEPLKREPVWEAARPFDIADYKNWQKVELKLFSFYLPRDVQKEKVKCYESGCYEFKGPSFTVDIDISTAAGRPYDGDPTKKLPGYREKYKIVDGVVGWIWSFQSVEQPFRYFSGIFMFCKDKNKQFNMTVTSETTDINEISEKIFSSIQFKTDSVCKKDD